MTYALSPAEIEEMSTEQIDEIVRREFTFDSFRWQNENHVKINETFRADGLNRVLYKCPHCMSEGKTLGKGTKISCTQCGKSYTLDEYGALVADGGEGKFTYVSDWYEWERQCVRKEIERGEYSLDVPVDICMTIDTKHLYHIGAGKLHHGTDGFKLESNDGTLNYEQKPKASYTVNSDFNWYELGDIISIGNNENLFYCFPKVEGDVVAKTRLAAEEIYKIEIARQKAEREAKKQSKQDAQDAQ
jgi:hypothetical protein